jgi:oligo-1,6-glucosidase
MSVAEGAGNSYKDAHDMVDADRNELNMAYAFEGVDIAGSPNGYSVLHFKEVFSRWDSVFASKGWLSIFLANHDQARMVSRFGNDSPQFRDLSSKMLTTFILTMRGTPYYYNGDELGMTNIRFDKIEDYRDMQTLNEYKHQQNIGADMQQFMEAIKYGSRDNGRTPMQWDSTKNAGFTAGTPWIKVNPNYKTINVAREEKDPNSCLNYFRNLVALRKQNKVLVYGKYTLLDKDNPKIYAYTREGDGKKILVLLNFSAENAQSNIWIKAKRSQLLAGNYPDGFTTLNKNSIIRLRPYEALVYELKN